MKYLKIAFGLVMVAGLMAVVASPAVAAPRWLTCEQLPTNTGKFTTNKCSTAGTGEWETKEITSTVEVTSSGTLTLEDTKATGGATAVECTGANTGTVGANGTDSVKTITNIVCNFVTGKNGSCETAVKPKVEPLNLGWSTRLEERTNAKGEKENRDVLTSLISGKNPGWKVECRVGGVFKISDECTGISSTNVRPNRTTGAVVTEFEAISEKEPATCTVGGAGSGLVRGTITLSLWSRDLHTGLITLLAFWPFPYYVA